jgi:hypothetical protein
VAPGETVTLTVPTEASATITLTVAAPDAAERLAAALADPAAVTRVDDANTRRILAKQLASLDAFLAPRPKLQPYRTHIWYVAHHARPPVSPRRVAALLWCTVWFPRACG